MLWLLFVVMGMIAVFFAIFPLIKDVPRKLLSAVLSIVLVSGLSAGLYYTLGAPDVPSGASTAPDVNQMVRSLEERLEQQPEDLNGWKMLGRSYMTLGNYQGAVDAYRRAVQLESAENAQTLVALGAAMVEGNGRQISSESISVFENALKVDPNNAEALFWGGIGAFNNGNAALAADRWETLLATDPPPEVRSMLTERIAIWRGETPPEAAVADTARVVIANVSVAADAAAAMPVEATVFVIARDPQQPSPPIAVTRVSLSELPLAVALGDRESMIPGRNLSGFAEFEVVARVSLSGGPAAQAGDWFGSAIARPGDNDRIELLIDERVQ
jgi:cytochrome c-type biogenesis protein CcmH